jgi:hypothetical protein
MRFGYPLFLCLVSSYSVNAAEEIRSVSAHPPVDASYTCSEHPEGQLPSLGDALGTDCVVFRLVAIDGRTWSRSHFGDGFANEDWYGWREPLLSPCDCEVTRVNVNSDTNVPGILGKPPASFIVFRQDDGTHFLYAHESGGGVGPAQSVECQRKLAKKRRFSPLKCSILWAELTV